VPVRMGIQDVAANELRRRVRKGDIVGSDRDHELRIFESAFHDLTDGKLFLDAGLADVLAEHDNLLD
jgi:hypothetical protein